MSSELQQPEEGERFYQTRSVRVVWIPPRPPEPSSRRRAIRVATIAAGVALAGVGVWMAGTSKADADTATSARLAVRTDVAFATDTSPAIAAAPMEIAAAPMEIVAATPVPARVQPVSYMQIPNDRDRREILRSEIARCKNPAAACDVSEVLRMGSELVQLRKRAVEAQLPR